MKFTIVISACNVAPYIARAVASIRAQNFADFEAVAVCETSADGTLENLRRAVGGDPRFKIIEQPRSGSASAGRNSGLACATGDYMIFVDGDDWIEHDALARFEPLTQEKPDVIAAEYRNWRDDDAGVPHPCGGERPHAQPGRTLGGAEALTEFLRDGSYRSATWRNLYRRQFLLNGGFRQIPGRRHQDDEWTPRVLFAASTVMISGIVYYNYRKRANSITTAPSPDSLKDIAANIRSAFEFWQANHFSPALAELLARWQSRRIAGFFAPRLRRRYPAELRGELLRHAMIWRAYVSMLCHAGIRDKLFATVVFTALTRQGKWLTAAEWWHDRIYPGSGELS